MPKPKIPNQRKANLEHKKRIEQYTLLIQQVYDNMAKEAAFQAVLAGASADTNFSFSDYPLTREAIKRLQSQLMIEVSGIIMRGTSEEWKQSNLVQDLVAKKVLAAYTGTSRNGDEYPRYFETNPDSLKAFQDRKDRGMNLSTRVWSLSEQYRSELEEAITAAIAPGTSAMSLAAQVKQYLKYPDKRFRRIKEKLADGTIKWHLSKNAKAFHPEKGVYRSSARNAQRLARTEINMSYRTAEQIRWKQFDFVVGYEVKTTQNGHHVEDICDILAGKYPKSFKFTGWHPQCMCYCIPILKTEDEFWADDDVKSVNEVTDLPHGFKKWIRDNEDRIKAAENRGMLPYFIRDNRDDVENILHPELRKKTALQIAAERHATRTNDDINSIRTDWSNRKINILSEAINNKLLPTECTDKIAEMNNDISTCDFDEFNRKFKVLNITAIRHESRDQLYDVARIKTMWSRRKLENYKDAIRNGFLPKSFFDKIKEMEMDILFFEYDNFNRKASIIDSIILRHSARRPDDIKLIKEKWNLRRKHLLSNKETTDKNIEKLKAIRNELEKNKIKSIDDINRIMLEFYNQYPEEFNFKKIKFSKFNKPIQNGSFTMGYSIHDKEIAFNTNAGWGTFSPLELLIKAFDNFRTGRKLTLDQLRQTDTMVHELLHQKAGKYVSLKGHYKGDYKRTAMEAMNELAARTKTEQFIRKMGGNTTGVEKLIKYGDGYKSWTSRIIDFAKKANLDINKVGNDFSTILTTKSYDTMDSELYMFFKNNVPKNKFNQDMNEILNAFEGHKNKSDWEKLIKIWFS